MVATVTSLTSAAVTTRYFERDGYYAKSDPEHRKASRWHGCGAAALGLGRHVSPSRFEAILSGAVPGTDVTLGRIREGKREHRPGVDITMQAPKSVSLAALVSGDARIVRAHDRAVEATLGFVEEHLLVTRQWNRAAKRHVRVKAPSMVAATFRHKANRNLEPHLHTHAVIANMTQRPDGTWASLDTGPLRPAEKLVGAHYRNELAARLRELGYALRPTMVGRVPGFEIEGIDRALLEEHSTRRQEIMDWVRSRGLADTAANRQRAALATRKAKDEPHHRELEAGWRARAKGTALDRRPPRPYASRQRAAEEAERLPTMLEIVSRSAEHLAERASVFRETDLCTQALAHSPGMHTHADYVTALDRLKRDGHLVDAVRRGLSPCLVTGRALRAEREIVRRMRAARDAGHALADAARVEATLAKCGLTEGQRDAVRTVLLGETRIAGVQGYAGTGKTAMLRTVGQLAGDRRVIALAPSAAAVRALRRESGLPARTLQGFLSRYRDVADGTASAEGLARLHETFAGSVLVLDEASMAGTVQMRSLMRIADRVGAARLALVGDTRQLRAIEAGQPFRQLQEAGMPTAVMDDVLRQRTPRVREAVAHAIGGRPGEALGSLGGDVHEVAAEDLGRTAGRLWLNLDDSARAGTAVLAPTHELRAEINATIRAGLTAEGALTGREMEIRRLVPRGMTRPQTGDIRNWSEGDAAVFHHDLWGGKAKAGEVFTVNAIEDERAELVHEDGRVLKVNPGGKRLRYQLDLYETATIRIRAGDAIRWTRNDNRRDLVNGERARVLAVGPKAVRLRTADGRGLMLSRNDPQLRHLDHAYSATVHGAQGTTADRVIAVLDSGLGALADQATFYVEVSRARDEAVILTDNREQLAETLEERTGLRMTALEAVGERTAERQPEAVPKHAPAIPESGPGIAVPEKPPVRTVAGAFEALREEARAAGESVLDRPGFRNLVERLERERQRPEIPEGERKALDAWRAEIDRETALRETVSRHPERCREVAKALFALPDPPGPEDAVMKAANALVAEGKAVLADPAAAPHLDRVEGLRTGFEAGLAAVDGAVAATGAERAWADWRKIEARAVAEGTNPFRSEGCDDLMHRVEALAGDARVPASRREAFRTILDGHRADQERDRLARDIVGDQAGDVRDRGLADLGDEWRTHRARAAAEGVSVAILPGTDALLERTGAFVAGHPGSLSGPVAMGVAECETRMRDLGGRLDRAGGRIKEAVRVSADVVRIEKDWQGCRLKAALQGEHVAFLPETGALVERIGEFARQHPGALSETTAEAARDCRSLRLRWDRLRRVAGDLGKSADTSEAPGESERKAMAEAEDLLRDDRLSGKAERAGIRVPLAAVLGIMNARLSDRERILGLQGEREALMAEAEREGCHPFHLPGYDRFMTRLGNSGRDLPRDLAAMVEEVPALEARDREIRQGVREVTDFVARRREIIDRAARRRPDTPLKRSGVGSYARWTRSAPKMIERGERLAKDVLLSPEDGKTLQDALARIRAAPEADGLDARNLKTWEELNDRAVEQGCHRWFVDGYEDFVTGLDGGSHRSPEFNRFAVRERSVLADMRSEDACLRRLDNVLAKAIRERAEGGEAFVSEMHPYPRWQRDAMHHVKELQTVLGDRERYDRHLARVPGLEKRLRDRIATVEGAIRNDAPERKTVEAAHEMRMEREREAARSRDRGRYMGAEIDFGR